MKTIYSFPSEEAEKKMEGIAKRGLSFSGDLYQQVAGYVEDVRLRGDAALVEYTNQFGRRIFWRLWIRPSVS